LTLNKLCSCNPLATRTVAPCPESLRQFPFPNTTLPVTTANKALGQAFLLLAPNPYRLQHLPTPPTANFSDNVTPAKHSQTGRNTSKLSHISRLGLCIRDCGLKCLVCFFLYLSAMLAWMLAT